MHATVLTKPRGIPGVQKPGVLLSQTAQAFTPSSDLVSEEQSLGPRSWLFRGYPSRLREPHFSL